MVHTGPRVNWSRPVSVAQPPYLGHSGILFLYRGLLLLCCGSQRYWGCHCYCYGALLLVTSRWGVCWLTGYSSSLWRDHPGLRWSLGYPSNSYNELHTPLNKSVNIIKILAYEGVGIKFIIPIIRKSKSAAILYSNFYWKFVREKIQESQDQVVKVDKIQSLLFIIQTLNVQWLWRICTLCEQCKDVFLSINYWVT